MELKPIFVASYSIRIEYPKFNDCLKKKPVKKTSNWLRKFNDS